MNDKKLENLIKTLDRLKENLDDVCTLDDTGLSYEEFIYWKKFYEDRIKTVENDILLITTKKA